MSSNGATATAVASERYVYREMTGVTVGHVQSSTQFLVLDSHDCYRPVLELHTGDERPVMLRPRVKAYARALNNPPICECGCREPLPIRFPMQRGPAQRYLTQAHRDRARNARRRV